MKALGTILGLVSLAGMTAEAAAHFHILLPSAAVTKRGQAVQFSYRWGHPFEHQMFDAQPPQAWFVLTPDGKRVDLSTTNELQRGEGQTIAYRAWLTPEKRGDYTCVLQCPPVWMEQDAEFVHDTVRVAVHVQAQKRWDAAAEQPLDLVPLTRPYGLSPGTVFQGQVLANGKPLAGELVEIERYNASPPKTLPPDEYITRTAKTDPNGVVTATLPDAGWWCLTARKSAGVKERAGKEFPVWRRITLWVYVGGDSDGGK